MNPLRVSCTTCQARLKVVDPAALGQILSCPKCGSMVHVAPPPGWSPEAAPQASAAWKQSLELRSSTDFADSTDAKAPPANGAGDSMVIGLKARTRLAAASDAAATKSTAAPSAVPQAVGMKQSPPPLSLPLPEPEGEVSRWFWPTMAGITFTGLIAAGIILQRERSRRTADAASPVSAPAAQLPAAAATTNEKRPIADNVNSKPSAASASAAPRASQPHSEAAVAAQQVLSSSKTPDSKPAAQAAPAPTVQLAAADPPKIAVPAPAPSKAEPPGTSKREPLVQPAQNPVAATAPPAAAGATLQISKSPNLQVAPHPSIERLPLREIDVDARLADPLPGIEIQNVPLWRFVNQISQLSTIPITLDLDELSEMNLSVEIPVSVQLKDSTVSGVLEEALTPHGLAPRVTNRQLVIGRAASSGLRRVRYAVGDLIGEKPNAAQQDQFAKLVHALVAPVSWKEAGGTGTSSWSDAVLVVDQNESAHVQLLVLCEKLRVARSLPLRSHLESERFRLEPRSQRAKAALAAPVTANFSRPEPLPRILAYLGEAAHVHLLIDHAAVADEQWSSDTEAYVTARQLPLGQALTALLEPLDLTYRVIDEHTLQITTPRAAARHLEVEFYPVRQALNSASDLADSVRRELAAAGVSDSLLEGVAIQYDAPSRCLLVSAPQSVQLRVQSALGVLRIARQ